MSAIIPEQSTPPPRPFDVCGMNVCESLSRHSPAQLQRFLNRLLEWRMNTLIVHPQYGYRLHESAIRAFCEEHNIALVQYLYTTLAFTPQAPLGMLAVNKAGRPHREGVECATRLCASHPQARRHFREGARRYLGEHVQPGDQVLLATADGLLLCACDKCRPLSAVAQWQPFLEIAVEEIVKSGKSLKTHFIAYVGRFRPPEDMGVFAQIDAVMFDTHLRHRWLPLGVSHALGPAESIEGAHDPEALQKPINVFLLEMLKKWRKAFHGKLYVFENLMIQSCFSLPQPNTPALLKDIETFRTLGVDGVIYEAFEPGIGAFEKQLSTLAKAAAGEAIEHRPTSLEKLCQTITSAAPIRTRVLHYLFKPEYANEAKLLEALGSPEQAKLAAYLQVFLVEPTYSLWRKIADHVLRNQETLDWIYIAYRLATYLTESERPARLTPLQAELFATEKPWDFLENQADTHATMVALLHSFSASVA